MDTRIEAPPYTDPKIGPISIELIDRFLGDARKIFSFQGDPKARVGTVFATIKKRPAAVADTRFESLI